MATHVRLKLNIRHLISVAYVKYFNFNLTFLRMQHHRVFFGVVLSHFSSRLIQHQPDHKFYFSVNVQISPETIASLCSIIVYFLIDIPFIPVKYFGHSNSLISPLNYGQNGETGKHF